MEFKEFTKDSEFLSLVSLFIELCILGKSINYILEVMMQEKEQFGEMIRLKEIQAFY